eukprot:CAMPEP_0175290710 /NCGR_PEP_ID=MMETSP0093-20121207/56016_1 /TAXON_ID=311494 /ORGANISM="Alexandrium monilatum, Strain CCMP3105" /LENGTH=61 /DNA_ID=CAMNT_0016586409 /DNA_START=26 /DNA_END=209 /DNA_ORIENTATION=+
MTTPQLLAAEGSAAQSPLTGGDAVVDGEGDDHDGPDPQGQGQEREARVVRLLRVLLELEGV